MHRVARITFDYLKQTAFLGGLGTGCLKLDQNGSTQFAGLAKTTLRRAHPGEDSDPVSFAICVTKDGDGNASGHGAHFALLKAPESDSTPTSVNLPRAAIRFEKRFPFASFSFDRAITEVAVQMTAFNPTILHNSVDSGIPAAFFEFTLTNPTSTGLTVSLCALLKSFSNSGKATLGYDTAQGVFYTEIAEHAKGVSARRRGSLAIATNEPNFTYEVLSETENNVFFEHFRENAGFLSNRAPTDAAKHMAALVASHVHLDAGETQSVRYLVAWNYPYLAESPAKGEEKNYYCHYFSDIRGCVSYCFSHFDRLWKESLFLRETLFEKANLPAALRECIECSLECVKDPALRRDAAGILKGTSGGIAEEGSGSDQTPSVSVALEALFPGITTPTATVSLKNLMLAKGKEYDSEVFVPTAYDTDCSPGELCIRFFMIMRLYYAYKTGSDLRFVAENFVDIACMVDVLCDSAERIPDDDADKFFEVYAAMLPTLMAMIRVSDILRDKKRKAAYTERLEKNRARFEAQGESFGEKYPLRVLSSAFVSELMCSYTLYDMPCLQRVAERLHERLDAGENIGKKQEAVFFSAAKLVQLYAYAGYSPEVKEARTRAVSDGITLVKQITGRSFSKKSDLYAAAMQMCALLAAFSGFAYDKNSMTLTVAPEESLLDADGLFREFVSFDGAYGYVEQGEDYIELTVLSGEVKVRQVVTSHTPYRVMYGGRFRMCDIDGKTVILDGNYTVTKEKKLTILIDTTK